MEKSKQMKGVKMRNSKGQFIHGHTPMNPQDRATGRFYSYKQYQSIEDKVDTLLKQRERL